eukprot:5193174-Prymnesium_polylepis.1
MQPRLGARPTRARSELGFIPFGGAVAAVTGRSNACQVSRRPGRACCRKTARRRPTRTRPAASARPPCASPSGPSPSRSSHQTCSRSRCRSL